MSYININPGYLFPGTRSIMTMVAHIFYVLHSITKEDLYIEAQQRGITFALIIKSSGFEGIFIDEKCVNCASLDTVHAKRYFI